MKTARINPKKSINIFTCKKADIISILGVLPVT